MVAFCGEEGRVGSVRYIACFLPHCRKEEAIAAHPVNPSTGKIILGMHTFITAQISGSKSVSQDLNVISDTNFLNTCRI